MGDLVRYKKWETVAVDDTLDIPPGQLVEVHLSAIGIETLSRVLPESMTAMLVNFERYIIEYAVDRNADFFVVGSEYRQDAHSIVVQVRSEGVPLPMVLAAVAAAAIVFGFTWLSVREVRLIVEESPGAALGLGVIGAVIIAVIVNAIIGD